MAYQYDEFGNVIGEYESEEERQKRLAELANTKASVAGPVMPDQTMAETQRLQIQNAQPAGVVVAPVTPTRTMAAPAMDQAAYIAQQESGNNPNIGYHNPKLGTAYGTYGLTAPAYADVQRINPQFAGRDITTLTPEEQTKAYHTYTAMNAGQLQRNGIEPTPGNLAAAHFLGATGLKNYLEKGEISPAAAKANGGEENVRRIVEGRLAQTASPSSGAVQQQPQPTAPVSPYSLSTGQTGLGLQVPGLQPQPVAEHPAMPAINAYQAAQNNPLELLKLRNDETMPEFIRERAGRQASDLMKMEMEKKDAENQAKALATAAAMGDRKAGNTIAKELQNQEGSWLKMILLGFISPQLAGEEAIKLGFGNKWVQGYNDKGESALMQVNAKGLPLKGYTADGNAIATNDLAAWMTGGKAGGTKADVSTQDVERNGQAGRVITQHMPNGMTKTMVESGGKLFPYDTSWKPRSIATSQAKADYALITDLKKKHGTNVLDAEKDYVTLNGPFKSAEERQEFRRVYGFDLAQPAAGGQVQTAPAGQAPTAGAPVTAVQPPAQAAPAAVAGPAPAGAPAATTSNINVPLQAQRDAAEARKAGQKEIITEAAKEVAKSADTQNLLNGIKKATDIIDSGNHNIGSVMSAGVGRGPIAQAIGSQFETKDARNTKTVMDTVQKLATEGLKALGSNPSTADLQFWTRFKPDASSDPEFVKEWIESRSEDLKRKLGYAEKQVEKGGQAGVSPEVTTESTLSPADKARAELERRRKEKK